MEIWIVQFTPLVRAMYGSYNDAVIRAGDYWSLQAKRHPPVSVFFYAKTFYETLAENRRAMHRNETWTDMRAKLVWRNGRPIEYD